ncbi:hypothetical protein [Rubrivirga sp.]|uniref:hypothetical protein n=1 Tax=Rubrivirga sp. TaxID=1885344 RepID=UPI003C7150E1
MIRLILAVLIAWSGAAAAQHAEEGRPPFELVRPQAGDGPLSVYLRLVEAEPGLSSSSRSHDWVVQRLAQEAGRLAMHDEALRWTDQSLAAAAYDSVGVLPSGVQAVGAVQEIARRAEAAQVVMVNEAHHDASTRLMTRDLLGPLYEQGYRYLAAETFTSDDVLERRPLYPIPQIGFYIDEPVFGSLVRDAIRLGYTLVRYEQIEDGPEDDTLSYQQRRDFTQAQNLVDRVLASDRDARILVHAGYSHVNERPGEYFHPMADYFQGITGIDPLTVDQVELGPRSTPAFEHPTYRAALATGLVANSPVILLDLEGEPLDPSGHEVFTDLQVVRPPTSRPVATLGYGTLRSFPLPGACGPCLVEVRRSDEGPDAVPVDRRVALEGGTVEVMGPRDVPLVVTVLDGTSPRVLDRRIAVAR